MCFDTWDLYTKRCLEVKDQQVYVHSVSKECQFDQSLSLFPGGVNLLRCVIYCIDLNFKNNKRKDLCVSRLDDQKTVWFIHGLNVRIFTLNAQFSSVTALQMFISDSWGGFMFDCLPVNRFSIHLECCCAIWGNMLMHFGERNENADANFTSVW